MLLPPKRMSTESLISLGSRYYERGWGSGASTLLVEPLGEVTGKT
jgi:hypothetical protein